MKLSLNVFVFLFLGGVVLLPLSSCNKKPESILSPLAGRGKGVYLSNCITCHHPNPTLDGSIGPSVAHSSIELIEARLLHRTYPPGYKPKRTSGQMPDFPQLKDDIPALHAYLNSFNR